MKGDNRIQCVSVTLEDVGLPAEHTQRSFEGIYASTLNDFQPASSGDPQEYKGSKFHVGPIEHLRPSQSVSPNPSPPRLWPSNPDWTPMISMITNPNIYRPLNPHPPTLPNRAKFLNRSSRKAHLRSLLHRWHGNPRISKGS